ncbi:methyltransferase domain-containing protein [Oceanobacillus sp. 143]|nr:methyltransferase domain-containing protein [Oceanobacillus sp. 143]
MYWNNRYENGAIWGTEKCPSAVLAQDCFREHSARNILVPGCGYGRNSLYLVQKGFNVTAFDISNIAIEYAREQSNKLSLNNLMYVVDSLFEPNLLKEKQFDGIYLSNIIHLFWKSKENNY